MSIQKLQETSVNQSKTMSSSSNVGFGIHSCQGNIKIALEGKLLENWRTETCRTQWKSK